MLLGLELMRKFPPVSGYKTSIQRQLVSSLCMGHEQPKNETRESSLATRALARVKYSGINLTE